MARTHIALIPAFEPDKKLLELLDEISGKTDFFTVVVDDGSGQAYGGVFSQVPAGTVILRHSVNRGKGEALKTGLRYIREHFSECSVIVTIDADGQHRLEAAVRVCKVEEESKCLVIGSRKRMEKAPLRSRLGNSITRNVFLMATGKKVWDTQTGLRAFGMGLVPFMLAISGSRYEYEMNVLIECAKRGTPIVEVPIESIYYDNNSSSHFDAIKDSYRIYKEIVKYGSASFLCFLLDYAAYNALLWATGGNLVESNVSARVISASVNYYINKRFVFKDQRSFAKSALGYFTLAAGVLFLDTALLSLSVKYFLHNKAASKLIIEALLFLLNWSVQHYVVFPNRNKKESGK